MKREHSSLAIAIAGNPNCGKTTIFNGLTKSDQRVGNWPGVTVEKKVGHFSFDVMSGEIIDLPGIYSLSANSEDEIVARKFLASSEYDMVIDIVDASNLERNLYLATQLREMKIPMVVVLNKLDIVKRNGFDIDKDELSKRLKAPVIAISAVDDKDIAYLRSELDTLLATSKWVDHSYEIPYDEAIEDFIASDLIKVDVDGPLARIGRRSVAVSLLEGDPVVTEMVEEMGVSKVSLEQELARVHKAVGDDLDIILAEKRYQAIGNLQKTVKKETRQPKRKLDIDSVVMHRFWGIPIFFGVMYLVFVITMTIGGAFIDFFDILFGAVFVDGFGALLAVMHSPDWLITFLAGGVGGGLQTISTFIPVIFFMFLMLGILEDSGYMARAAFVMDRFMRFVGLPGKAFIPMLVGYGCTVPAIMATRTLDSKRDRFLTIFMVPFMSCGARLPVYALFAAAFFSKHAGLVVFSIYLAGIVLAIITGLILKRTLFKGEFSPFIMELPEYHIPKFKKVMYYSWERLKIFMFRAGKVIIIVVFVLTVLGSWGVDGTFNNENSDQSVLAAIGKAITPIFEPMGISRDNWPATVGLFSGIFAKEAVIGTLNSLYLDPEEVAEGDEAFNLGKEVIRAFTVLGENLAGIFGGAEDPLGFSMVSGDEETVAESVDANTSIFIALRSHFTPAGAYAYMLFILIYFPCVAVLGTVFREVGKSFGIVMVLYLTILAWVVSVFVYQIAEGHSVFWILSAMAVWALVYVSLTLLGKREERMEASLFL